MSLLTVSNLSVVIGAASAVDDVSFTLHPGETFALLGESGCGKSLTALALMRLLPSAATLAAGRIVLGETDLCRLPESALRKVRGGKLAMIFQEPATSLNPVMTVGAQITEALSLHAAKNSHSAASPDATSRVVELLAAVGIPDPARRAGEYPFQMSGGMKQRAMIAMALAGEPEVLIADEPTTALDVTIQAQVLDLLRDLQRQRGMAMLLITHDLGVVAQMADRIGLMYAGQLVEVSSRAAFFAAPGHPYARRLFAALPEAGEGDAAPHPLRDMPSRQRRLLTIPGSVPPLGTRFAGCRFADRCAEALPICQQMPPPWRDVSSGQRVRCHLEPGAKNVPKVGAGGMECPEAGTASNGMKVVMAAAESAAEGALEPVSSSAEPLLSVSGLQVHFPIRRGVLQRAAGQVRAVDGVDLALPAGRTLALVGESGCGKTTVGRAILGLQAPTAGALRWAGAPLAGLAPQRMQMVFQDPFGSLNPRMRVGDIVREGNPAVDVGVLLAQVGLAADMAGRYPHEFSGGQRQRIAIARALAVRPQLLICDEPTSALDVSVQAQILNLLSELQETLGLAYLFITHNLAVVNHLAHEVAVMYLGRIVERGRVDEVLQTPRHPYTQALLAAVPGISGREKARERVLVKGDPPSPANPPAGCHFHPRCPMAEARCREAYPATFAVSASQRVACWLAECSAGSERSAGGEQLRG